MASSRSEENVNLNYFTNWWSHSYGETCSFFGLFCNECIGRCCGQCLLIVWQMLLPIMFDIMSPVRCYYLMISGVVVTTVRMADVIAMR